MLSTELSMNVCFKFDPNYDCNFKRILLELECWKLFKSIKIKILMKLKSALQNISLRYLVTFLSIINLYFIFYKFNSKSHSRNPPYCQVN